MSMKINCYVYVVKYCQKHFLLLEVLCQLQADTRKVIHLVISMTFFHYVKCDSFNFDKYIFTYGLLCGSYLMNTLLDVVYD